MPRPPISTENPWVPPRDRTPPPMDHLPGHKESAFTVEMGELILERIAAGETVKQVTADPAMPAYATVYRWTHVIPEFGEAWVRLRARICADRIWLDQQRAVAKAWMAAHRGKLAGKPEEPWKTGKASTYTPAWGAAVCAAIAEGASLSEVVRTSGMPGSKAVYNWLRRFPEFRLAYVEACGCREFLLHEMAIEVATTRGWVDLAGAKREVAKLDERVGRTAPKKYRALPPEDVALKVGG
ncbi:hypothetical protein [Phenylobacterium sp.]|uniref:terminase small subunit-like protein n=1 Tax=Phenylobacterium sp. TaxID=1871053 RepID=UPI002DE35E62|nr:hypothetical protein [Phenylobacterium sp.]